MTDKGSGIAGHEDEEEKEDAYEAGQGEKHIGGKGTLPEGKAGEGGMTMDIAYYPGCSLHASSELYDIQCKMVFRNLGIELKEIEDWNCCGATAAAKTDDFLAIALPARNLGIADAPGLSEIVIPCSSCYTRTLVSQKRLSCERSGHERGD